MVLPTPPSMNGLLGQWFGESRNLMIHTQGEVQGFSCWKRYGCFCEGCVYLPLETRPPFSCCVWVAHVAEESL